MKQSVFIHRNGVVVPTTVVIMLIWALFVVPGGAPWTGIAWLGALAVLLVATAMLLIGLARTPSMARVDHRRRPGE